MGDPNDPSTPVTDGGENTLNIAEKTPEFGDGLDKPSVKVSDDELPSEVNETRGQVVATLKTCKSKEELMLGLQNVTDVSELKIWILDYLESWKRSAFVQAMVKITDANLDQIIDEFSKQSDSELAQLSPDDLKGFVEELNTRMFWSTESIFDTEFGVPVTEENLAKLKKIASDAEISINSHDDIIINPFNGLFVKAHVIEDLYKKEEDGLDASSYIGGMDLSNFNEYNPKFMIIDLYNHLTDKGRENLELMINIGITISIQPYNLVNDLDTDFLRSILAVKNAGIPMGYMDTGFMFSYWKPLDPKGIEIYCAIFSGTGHKFDWFDVDKINKYASFDWTPVALKALRIIYSTDLGFNIDKYSPYLNRLREWHLDGLKFLFKDSRLSPENFEIIINATEEEIAIAKTVCDLPVLADDPTLSNPLNLLVALKNTKLKPLSEEFISLLNYILGLIKQAGHAGFPSLFGFHNTDDFLMFIGRIQQSGISLEKLSEYYIGAMDVDSVKQQVTNLSSQEFKKRIVNWMIFIHCGGKESFQRVYDAGLFPARWGKDKDAEALAEILSLPDFDPARGFAEFEKNRASKWDSSFDIITDLMDVSGSEVESFKRIRKIVPGLEVPQLISIKNLSEEQLQKMEIRFDTAPFVFEGIGNNANLLKKVIECDDEFFNNLTLLFNSNKHQTRVSGSNAMLERLLDMYSAIGSSRRNFELMVFVISKDLGTGKFSTDGYEKYKLQRGSSEEDVFVDYARSVLCSDDTDLTVKNRLPEFFVYFPELNFLDKFDNDNILFSLLTYSRINENFEDEKSAGIRKAVLDKIEENKNAILKFLNNIRDRLLNKGLGALTPEERSAIKIIAEKGVPHFKTIQRTVEYINMFFPYSCYSTFSSTPLANPTHEASLIKKFAQRDKNKDRDINYSDNDYVSFYEKCLRLGKIDAFLLRKILIAFDELGQNRQNFLYMQEKLLNSCGIIIMLSKAVVERKGISRPVSYDYVFKAKLFDSLKEKLGANKDPVAQMEVLKSANRDLEKLLVTVFEQSMGLKNLPEITPDAMNHLSTFLTYYSNIENSDGTTKVDILSLFILLKLLGKWEDFKQGKDVDVEEYLDDSVKESIMVYLKDRKALDIFEAGNVTGEGLSIPAEKESSWMATLNEKTESVLIGESVGIIDTLHQIERSSLDLMDPDNFNDEEKMLLDVVRKHGQKNVGKALSMKFRDRAYTDEVIQDLKFPDSVDFEKILLRYQKIARIMGSLLKFSETLNSTDISGRVEALNAILLPSSEVVAVYRKIGEEMETDSGARPVNEDVEHLESILHKRKEELSGTEFSIAQAYIEAVKVKVLDMYSLRDQLVKEFTALDESAKQTSEISDSLKSRFQEFRKLFMIESSERRMTFKSTMTGDLEDVIPHIRQCLGCQTKECNNDTNLTFGDRNRFSVITREFHMPESKSLSDELVTVQVTVDDSIASGESSETSGERTYSFVMDNVYGKRDRDILISNVLVVMNKVKKLRGISPKTKIDVFVTGAALSSCGVTEEYLRGKIKSEFGHANVKSVERNVTIAKSASGDGHYEIGGPFGGRVSEGSGSVAGISITL